MPHEIGVLPVLAALTLVSGGCVSRGLFVKETAVIEAQELVVERRVDDHEERLTALETSIVQVADLGREARDRADVALARMNVVERRATPPGTARDRNRVLLGIVDVLFGFGSSLLDDGAQKALLSIVRELRGNSGLTVDLEGATDSKGSRAYNVQLSQRRVEAVRRFLLANGIQSLRIVQASAVGPLSDASTPENHKRRVAVKLMKLAE
jgi:outer membrane protein OmpA-like peptidoglycan-associated protein